MKENYFIKRSYKCPKIVCARGVLKNQEIYVLKLVLGQGGWLFMSGWVFRTNSTVTIKIKKLDVIWISYGIYNMLLWRYLLANGCP